MHLAPRGAVGILSSLLLSTTALAQTPVLPDSNAPTTQDPNAQQPQYRYQYTAPQQQPAQPPAYQYQQPPTTTQQPAPSYQYQQPAQPAQPSYQYQQPAQPAQPAQPSYQYQQPAQPQQPAYQQPAYQPPAAQPQTQYQQPAQRRPNNANEPSLVDDVQSKLIYHAKRATIMSLPALGVLAVGLVVGAVLGGIVAGVALGYGISSGVLNANLAPVLVLMALPALPLGAVLVGGIAYTIARIVTVALVSMFYPGDAENMDDRIRNMRVNIVADLLGHVGSTVAALSLIGFATVVAALVSSFVGLAALVAIVQSNVGKSFDQIRFDPLVSLPLLLVGLGITGLVMAGGAFVINILLAHVALPFATVMTKATVFGDSDARE